MKKWGFALLLAISMLLALCISANAAEVKYVGNETELKAAFAAGGSATIKLSQSFSLSSTLTVPAYSMITLDLNGIELTYSGTEGSAITVANATLIIADSAAEAGTGYGSIFSAGRASCAKGGGLYIGDGGTVEMKAGSITNCGATEKGGGAYVASGGKLQITGDSYFLLCAAPSGGGVYVDTGGTLEMSAGSIYSCEANKWPAQGGGVYVNAGGTFTMTGGQIVECKASESGDVYGGGVYVTSMGNLAAYGEPSGGEKIEYGFRMSGGTIQKCTANSSNGNAYGGGVYVGSGGDSDGVFEMDGSSNIESCRAYAPNRAFGGGVCVENTVGGLFKMNNGKIWNCEAESRSTYSDYAHGGGVCAKRGVFEMNGGRIESTCTSTENNRDTDGGVCIGCVGDMGIMRANGGSVECTVMNHYQIVCTNSGGCTEFTALVKNDYMDGSISGGMFRGPVDNHGDIKGGEFYGTVNGYSDGSGYGTGGYISGGTFHGLVNGSDRISGGTFEKKPQYAGYVTFETRGGVPVPEMQVRLNVPATEPDPAPTKGNQAFLGWYTDSECTQRYTFSDKSYDERIKEDITLYALWENDRCTVTFDSNGGSEVKNQMGLFSGYTAEEPVDPTKNGATFLGWFTEDGKHWNFTHDLVSGNITLTAKWSDGGTPTPPSTVAVTGVTLDKTSLTLVKGSSETLHVTVAPENATNKTVLWSSTDASVADVKDGTVAAVKAGMALIIARTADGNYIAVCTVTVTEDTPVETCTVSFDANDGSGTMENVSVRKGSSYTLPACGFTAPEGMEFDAWQIGSARYGVGALYPVSANTTVRALWKISAAAPVETCTVSFDANNGTGSMDSVSVQKGSSYQLPACGFTAPEGMEFDAWQIGSARYGVGALYPVSANTTVKALWRSNAAAPGTCTVSFDANGGTGTMASVRMQTGSSFPLPICGFTAPAGKQFAGWARSADGAAITGGTINVTADTTLYAIWEDIPAAEFVILFDANGGTATFNSLTTVGQRLPSLPGAVRGGYRFDGWYTAKAGGSRVTTETVFSANATVYAHWTYLSSGGSGGNGGGTVTPPATEDTPKQDSSFDDVPSGSYYEDAVSWAVENKITDGTDAARFSPDSVCTRAQAVTFLYRAAGSPAPASQVMPFTDVPAGSYYARAVLWAVETGITKGTSENTFSPDAPCTRAQIVSFLYRMIQSEGGGFAGLWMFRLPFTDAPDWAYEAIAWCYQKGITAGTTATTFSPDAGCTRAQIVTFLWRCKK